MTFASRIAGIRRNLDCLEEKARLYKACLEATAMGCPLPPEARNIPYEAVVVTEAETETAEELILHLYRDLTGDVVEPPQGVWERAHPFCKRNQTVRGGASKAGCRLLLLVSSVDREIPRLP